MSVACDIIDRFHTSFSLVYRLLLSCISFVPSFFFSVSEVPCKLHAFCRVLWPSLLFVVFVLCETRMAVLIILRDLGCFVIL